MDYVSDFNATNMENTRFPPYKEKTRYYEGGGGDFAKAGLDP